MYTFRQRLIAILLGLVVLTQLATVGIFVLRSHIDAKQQAEASLPLAGNMLEALLTSRDQQMREGVRVLATDFGFKSAVASGDAVTIQSALANFANRVGAKTATLLDRDGKTLASSDSAGNAPRVLSLHLPDDSSSEAQLSYQALEGQLHLLVAVPVRAPVTVGFLVVAFPVDENYAGELSELLGVSVSFVELTRNSVGTVASNDSPQIRARTLDWLRHSPNHHAAATSLRLDGQDYLSVARDVPDGHGAIVAVLQQPLQSAIAATFSKSALVIVLIGLLAILLAVPPARWLAKQASRPLEALLTVAKRIEAGDYRQNIHLRGSVELDQVASTLNAMQQQIAAREQQVRHWATHDAATGLPNRLSALEWLKPKFEQARQQEQRVPLLLLEISDFVRIQASLGHEAAEALMRNVIERLRAQIGATDLFASLASAQFLIVSRTLSCSEAKAFAQQLIASLHQGLEFDKVPISLDSQVGLCYFPDHVQSPLQALQALDLALHDAIQTNQSVHLYRNVRQHDQKMQMVLLADLRRTIQEGGLSIHYQPKVHLEDGRVLGLEALVRWQHPVLGVIAPDRFIPLLEQSRSIWQLSRWLLAAVPEQMRQWQTSAFEPDVSINLSAADLLEPQMPEHLLTSLAQAGISPHKLVLEITESAIMNEPAKAIKVMQELRQHGLRFSVDDFGTGYSSLAQFKTLPVDELKIDRSFVKSMQPGSDDAIIVQATIDLGHRFGVSVVAEGIETTECWQQLLAMGCDHGQGYLISKPLPAAQLLTFIQAIEGQFMPQSPGAERQAISAWSART